MPIDNELVCAENHAEYDYDFYDITDCQYYILTEGRNEDDDND